MGKCYTALANNNLDLTVDRYHTKEEPSQKASKVLKFCKSESHYVACVLLVAPSPHYWAESDIDFIYEYSMNLIKFKFCDDLFHELLCSTVRCSGDFFVLTLSEFGPG